MPITKGPSREGTPPLWRRAARRAFPVSSETRLRRDLRRLGARVTSFEGPGTGRFQGFEVGYVDPYVFATELKDIFDQGIYDFESDGAPRVLDCGSHIGMSILYTKMRHPDARITAFEPDPEIFTLLEENLRRNGVQGVELINAALHTANGTQSFAAGKDAGHLSRTDDLTDFEVSTVRLGRFLETPVDYLKMNIEGAELEVLRDCRNRLGRVSQMVIEYHGFAGSGQYLHEMLALLDECGFRYLVHDFDDRTNPATKPPFRVTADTTYFLLVYATRSI